MHTYVCIYVYAYIRITYVYMYHEPKFKQDVKTRSKHSGEDVINNMSSLMNQNLNRTQNHEAITAART